MDIHFLGKYDKKMFLQATRLVEKRSAIGTALRWLSLLLALFVIANGIYTWIAEDLTVAESSKLARHGVTLVLLGYYYIQPYFSQRRRVTGLFSKGIYRIMQGIASVECIQINPPGQQAVMFSWGQFYRKGKKDNLLAILTLDGNLAIFHRDFFQSDSDWNRFNQLVDQKVIEPK
jgi:hypothetical protein